MFDFYVRDENGRSCLDGLCILGESFCIVDLCFYLGDVVKFLCFLLFEEL